MAILAIVILYIIYHFTTTYTIVKINKHIEPFTEGVDKKDKVIITNVPIQQKAPNELNYNDRADVVIHDAELNNIIDDLLTNKSNVPEEVFGLTISQRMLLLEPLTKAPAESNAPELFIIIPLDIVFNEKAVAFELALIAVDAAEVYEPDTTRATNNESPPLLK